MAKIRVTMTYEYEPKAEHYSGETDIRKMMAVDERSYRDGLIGIEEMVPMSGNPDVTFEVVE